MIIRSSVMIMRSSVRGVTTLRNELTDFLFLIRIITRMRMLQTYYAPITRLLCACYAPVTDVTRLLRAYYAHAHVTNLLRAYYAPVTRLLQILRTYYARYKPITRLLRAYYAPITHLLRIYFFCYAGTLRRSVTTRNFDTETRNEA